ncbi:MAG: type II toxin-antitoxin system RelE/ParE family toxin [Actinomycetota bacterium]
MGGFGLTPAAADLDAVYEHIALDNVPAAGRLLHRFTTANHRITQTPGIGHLREDLTEASLRFWSVRSYLVI